MVIRCFPPLECDQGQIESFRLWVESGGEVGSDGLTGRILRARLLAFAGHGRELLGVGALKVPNVGYRTGVFERAGATVFPDSFGVELGWFVVDPKSRGRGIGDKLVAACLAAARGEAVFATTRVGNAAMRHLLGKHGFREHGKPYSSKSGADTLGLFIRVVA